MRLESTHINKDNKIPVHIIASNNTACCSIIIMLYYKVYNTATCRKMKVAT